MIQAPDAREQIAGLTFALILLSPDLVIREVNPAAENLLGISARRLIGQSLFAVFEPGEQRVREKLEEGDAQIAARSLEIRVGERVLEVNLTMSPLPHSAGWRIVTLSDAGQGDLMEGKAQGALRGPAVLAHEIKNPLSAIRGAAQLLARNLEESDRALTSIVVDEVDRIAQLIDRMQRLGREQPEPVGPVNLHEAIRRACATLRAADGSVPVREEFDPSLPRVLANEGALVQVMVNLLVNARDACRGVRNPEIVIRTRFVSGLVVNLIRLGQPVQLPIEIQVSDNGPGIDAALRGHIFEPFVSSKQNGQGLGLALVNKLVRDMSGRVSHDRDEGKGQTHFRVHLPTAQ
ncbi:two-component system sensor histidine kinase NtrB [Altericroceibacterium xinjiangense]|uniref:two-component system sensor histidine kinase NtrB n=1 Tax=Altericroceibacterium xinjiangense TaxID=762261 RepID=UPI000F7F7EAB|nr:ATP-binding protein [Altericroceibacterium xinjiangense]